MTHASVPEEQREKLGVTNSLVRLSVGVEDVRDLIDDVITVTENEIIAAMRLSWERAKHAARDAWNRVSDTVERAIPGDSDRDGK